MHHPSMYYVFIVHCMHQIHDALYSTCIFYTKQCMHKHQMNHTSYAFYKVCIKYCMYHASYEAGIKYIMHHFTLDIKTIYAYYCVKLTFETLCGPTNRLTNIWTNKAAIAAKKTNICHTLNLTS